MELTNYKTIDKGYLVATFDVTIEQWGLTIKNCTLFRKDSRQWVGLPQKQYQAKDGSTKNFDLVAFDKARKARFDKAVFEKIAAGQYIQKTNNTAPTIDLPF